MKPTDPMLTDLKQVQQQLKTYLHTHWKLFLAEGMLFIMLGIAAITIPQLFGLAITIFLGWLIVFGGATQISRALYFKDMPGFGLWFGLGIVQIIVGYLLITSPVAGLLTLTMMMALFFALEGSIKIALALMFRPLVPHWNLMFFSGVTALVFALIVLTFWSETEHWLLGLFLGINMILLGGSIVRMSLHYKAENRS